MAPYGDDITEGLPYALSNPVSLISYSGTSEAYDIAISGLPFFVNANDETPYRRQTAPYRKQQIDQSNEPGEQTLTGWWIRSQSSFHNGSGVNFYDPSAGESVLYRFADSRGVNVWNKGAITLLKSCTQGHIVTGTIASNGVTQQHLRSIEWTSGTTTQGVLLLDEYDVDKIDSSGTVTHFVDYNSGAGVYPVYAICDDGTYAYWVTNITSGGSAKITVRKKPLSGSASNTADESNLFDSNFAISNAEMEYIKERIILCADNKVYEFSTSATVLPSPIYTHPATSHVYTSIAASGPAIYVAGYNGIQSTIQKFTLAANGTLPTLTSAVIAAEMPTGEIIHKIHYYLGYLIIGTNKGVRVALINETDGSINYGPLIVETSQPVYDFSTRDRFVWCTTGVAGSPGLIRIDLGAEISTLRFAWANDVYYPDATNRVTTSCAFIGNTDRILFTTCNNGTTDGYVYSESATVLMPSGYVTTGKIRYSTLESKVFKFLNVRADNTNGGFEVSSIGSDNQYYTIAAIAKGDFIPEVGVPYPQGAQEYISLQFKLSRDAADSTKGPSFSGYQLKSLPAVPRQRLIQYPVACYDRETDKFGVQVGYENYAYERLIALETLENTGDSVKVEDFRTGEAYIGLIEEVNFINRTPTDKRFSGFGGILLITVRAL